MKGAAWILLYTIKTLFETSTSSTSRSWAGQSRVGTGGQYTPMWNISVGLKTLKIELDAAVVAKRIDKVRHCLACTAIVT